MIKKINSVTTVKFFPGYYIAAVLQLKENMSSFLSFLEIMYTDVEQINCPSTKESVGGIQLNGLSDTQRRM